MKILYIVLSVVAVLVLIGWIGLKIKPSAFPVFAGRPAAQPQTVPLPKGLPAPVERFYRVTYGEQVPVITSAVLTGRGSMAPFGVDLPMRFRFLYDLKGDYSASIETTFFNLPFMKVSETYIDGHGLGRMPYGTDQGAWFDEAMNLRVWCEVLTWFPAALVTDPRVSWQAVDDEMAILSVPFGDKQQHIVVRFHPQTGLVEFFEVVKHRDATHRTLWINAIWFDQGKSWVKLDVEETLFNVATAEAIRGK